MLRSLISLCTLLFFVFSSMAQISEDELELRKREKLTAVYDASAIGGGLPEQECISAIAVCQDTYDQPTAYSGFGDTQEVPDESCLSSREKNSVWYIFTVQTGGTLDFVIDPNANSDDYDFAVYDLTGVSCSDIISGVAPEVRCNYCADPGNTGLSSQGQNPSEPCCAYDQCQFSTIMNVSAGETYVLVVSNYTSSQSGYSLTFGGTADIFDPTAASPVSAETPCGTGTVNLRLSEAVLCSSIASDGSDFSLSGPGGPFTVSGATGTNCGNASPQLVLNISPEVFIGSEYTLTVNTGSDQNSLIDNCDNETPPGTTLVFTAESSDAEISGPDNVCQGSPVTLTASAGIDFEWDNGETTQSITVYPMENTTYEVAIYSGNCQQTASTTVNVNPSPIANFTFGPADPCEGEVVSFTNTSDVLKACILSQEPCESNADCGGLPCVENLTFSVWDFGDGSSSNALNPNHTFSDPGSYSVTLLMDDAFGGCSNEITIPVTVLADGGELAMSDNITICAGQTTTLTASGGNGYAWTSDPPGFSSSDAQIEVSPTVTTTYTASSAGCSAPVTGSVTVFVNPLPSVAASSDQDVICAGLSTLLTGSGASSYDWSPSTGLSSTSGASVTASPVTTTTYTVTGTDGNGCEGVATVNVNVSIALQPSITPNGPLVYCEGDAINVELDAGSGYEGYEWNDDSDEQVLLANNAGTYTVTVFDDIGCIGTDEVTIDELPLPVVQLINDTTIIQGQSVDLLTSGGTSYSWSPVTGLNDPNVQNPIASPNETTTYIVTVSGSNGCDTRDTVMIMVEIPDECQVGKLFIPTAFSPNGDGLNDVFKIQITGGYDSFLLSVRDRWGQTVFESTDINIGWDGKMDEASMSSDAFGYSMEIVCAGRVITRQGSVTLVR